MKKKPSKPYTTIQSEAGDALKARQRKRPRLPFPKHWKSWRLVEAGEMLHKDDLVWPISCKKPNIIDSMLNGESVRGEGNYLPYGFYYRRTK